MGPGFASSSGAYGSRVAPGAITDLSPAQQKILDIVKAFPGITIQDVAKQCGCSHPTSAYHLSALARRGHIRRSRDGRAVRHYAAAGTVTGDAQYVAALERDERRRRIIAFIRSAELANVSINQIRSRLGLPYGLIKRTLLQLERQGLIALVPGRYTYVIELKGPWARPKPDEKVAVAILLQRLAPSPMETRP